MRLALAMTLILIFLPACLIHRGGTDPDKQKKESTAEKRNEAREGAVDDEKSFAGAISDLEPWMKRLDQCHREFTKVEIEAESTMPFDNQAEHVVEAYLNKMGDGAFTTIASLQIRGGATGDKFDLHYLGKAEEGVIYTLTSEFPNLKAPKGSSWMWVGSQHVDPSVMANGSYIFTSIPAKKWQEFTLEIDAHHPSFGRLRGKFSGCWVGDVHDQNL